MSAYECGDSNKSEKKWFVRLEKCEQIVGRSLADIEAHSDLFDLYSDGCTPQEAIDESLAQNMPH